jgi:polyribonucleotide nucleotidyltransferase
LTSRMIDRRGRTLAAKVFVKEVGISWNLLVVGVEEDSELLVISDASIDSLGHVLLMAGSRVGWAVGSVLLNLAQEGVGGQ